MSVVIKGVEAPISCNKCFCCDDDARFCMAKQEYIPTFGKPDWCPLEKPKWCPLVELPEKHGRLIDADKLFDAMKYSNWKVLFSSDGTFLDISKFSEIIRNIPTVVEAEEGE